MRINFRSEPSNASPKADEEEEEEQKEWETGHQEEGKHPDDDQQEADASDHALEQCLRGEGQFDVD
jgi:hypothetical protein